MVRPFLLVVLPFLFPILLSAQEKRKPEQDSIKTEPSEAFQNEVGIGFHSLYLLDELWNGPSDLHLLLQSTYKRKLEHFTLRAGVGGGIMELSSETEDKGWSLILNIGIERTVWRIGERFQMGFALDLVHKEGWREYLQKFRGNGIGLTWVNSLSLTPSSSLSLEAGLSYVKYGTGRYDNNLDWKDRRWGLIGYALPVYRGFLISYNYHF